MTDTRVSQEAINVVGESSITLNASLAAAYVVGIYPAEFIEASQYVTTVVGEPVVETEVSQAAVMVVGRGRVANPRLRAWTYTLDGHDFYVLRLGDDLTLVYDLTTEQWSRYTSSDLEFWRANTGMNWRDALGIAHTYGSNVVVGDDTFGLLWFLDPDQGYDEHPVSEIDEIVRFERVATGQMIAKARNYSPCYAVYLSASGGFPSFDEATVELKYSDDAGNTFISAGTQPVDAGNYNQNLDWYSLGSYTYPGRLFQIVDDGALARIDEMDIGNGATAS